MCRAIDGAKTRAIRLLARYVDREMLPLSIKTGRQAGRQAGRRSDGRGECKLVTGPLGLS